MMKLPGSMERWLGGEGAFPSSVRAGLETLWSLREPVTCVACILALVLGARLFWPASTVALFGPVLAIAGALLAVVVVHVVDMAFSRDGAEPLWPPRPMFVAVVVLMLVVSGGISVWSYQEAQVQLQAEETADREREELRRLQNDPNVQRGLEALRQRQEKR